MKLPTYDVLVSDELMPEFTNDNPNLPKGFRVIGPADGPSGYRSTRVRVEDDSAPDWTEGRLVAPTLTAEYDDAGQVTRTSVTDYRLEDEEAAATSEAVMRAQDNPGRTFEAKGGTA